MPAILAHGTVLKIGDGASPEVFAEIGQIGDFDDNDSVPTVDVTNHGSNGHREFIGDVIEGDDLTFQVFYDDDDATHARATGLYGMKGLRKNFRIEAPNESEGKQFAAIITNVGRSFPVSGGALTMSITLKKTGAPSYYNIT